MLVMGAASALAMMCLYLCSQFPEEHMGNAEPSEMLLQELD